MPRWKHYASVTWDQGPWSATLAQTYQIGVHRLPADRRRANAAPTSARMSLWDLQGSYTGFKNWTLTLGVKNLFDTESAAVEPAEHVPVGLRPVVLRSARRASCTAASATRSSNDASQHLARGASAPVFCASRCRPAARCTMLAALQMRCGDANDRPGCARRAKRRSLAIEDMTMKNFLVGRMLVVLSVAAPRGARDRGAPATERICRRCGKSSRTTSTRSWNR